MLTLAPEEWLCIPLSGGQSAQGRLAWVMWAHGLRGWLSQAKGEVGAKVRVRCVKPWPLSVILCPLLGGPSGLCSVSLGWPMG